MKKKTDRSRDGTLHNRLPPPLSRAPKKEGVERAQMDRVVFTAVEAVAAKLLDGCDSHLRMTEGHLLKSMKLTHRSLVTLVQRGERNYLADVLPITRTQMERVFIALLLRDDPDRWHPVYRKNAWKAFATEFLRARALLGHLPGFEYYQRSDVLGPFARELGVTDDEVANLCAHMQGETADREQGRATIPKMPTPVKVAALLRNPLLKPIADYCYPHYNDLCHFSHGGFLAVMIGGVLSGVGHPTEEQREKYFYNRVIEPTIPTSYIAMVTVATLFGEAYKDDPELLGKLAGAWSPYCCDCTPLGVAIWDNWAKGAIGALG